MSFASDSHSNLPSNLEVLEVLHLLAYSDIATVEKHIARFVELKALAVALNKHAMVSFPADLLLFSERSLQAYLVFSPKDVNAYAVGTSMSPFLPISIPASTSQSPGSYLHSYHLERPASYLGFIPKC